MMAYSLRKMLVNPRFGSRRCRGICPPSKPRILLYPEIDFAPLAPRPEYLPRPVPMPWPMRRFVCFWPLGGRKLLRFISVQLSSGSPCLFFHDFEQVRHLRHHAAETRRIRTLDDTIYLLQAKRPHDIFMSLGRTDGAAHQLDLNFSFSHFCVSLDFWRATPFIISRSAARA